MPQTVEKVEKALQYWSIFVCISFLESVSNENFLLYNSIWLAINQKYIINILKKIVYGWAQSECESTNYYFL